MNWRQFVNYLWSLGLIWHVGPQGWILSDLFTRKTFVENYILFYRDET